MLMRCQCKDIKCKMEINISMEERDKLRNQYGVTPVFVHAECKTGKDEGKLIEAYGNWALRTSG